MLNPLPVKTQVKGASDVPPKAVGGPIAEERSSGGFESAVQAAMQEREAFSGSSKTPLESDDQQTVLSPNKADAQSGTGNGVGKDPNPSIGGDSTPSGILLAETGLQGADALPLNGEQAFQQLMPLLGGNDVVDPALSRFHGVSPGVANEAATEPLMTQPLQDAMARVNQGANPAPLDPLSGIAVQELLDSEAIQAKEGLRKHALASPNILQADEIPKSRLFESGGVANAVATPLDEGLRQLMGGSRLGNGLASQAPVTPPGEMAPSSPGLGQSAPWLGVKPERNFVAEAPLVPGERLLASPIPMAPIEHALLTADIRDASAPQLTETAKLMASSAPPMTPDQTAPWARSLLETVSPAGVHASDGRAMSPQDALGSQNEAALDSSDYSDSESDEMARSEPQLKSGLMSGEVSNRGFRSSLTSATANPLTTESPVTAQAPSAEGEGPRPTQALKASIQSQMMTPQMAMASDDVAEFTVVKPDQMDVRIQDLEGELELSVAREEDGLSVKVRAPREIIEDFQDMRGDVENALSEDGEELSSFDAEANDTSAEDSSGATEGTPDETEDERLVEPSVEGLGARVLSRLV